MMDGTSEMPASPATLNIDTERFPVGLNIVRPEPWRHGGEPVKLGRSEMTPIKAVALHLQVLDRAWSLGYSEHTHQFYVSLDAQIGGDGLLCSVTEHRDTPEQAIDAAFKRLAAVSAPNYIVTDAFQGDRKHWRWNGAAFVEVPRGK